MQKCTENCARTQAKSSGHRHFNNVVVADAFKSNMLYYYYYYHYSYYYKTKQNINHEQNGDNRLEVTPKHNKHNKFTAGPQQLFRKKESLAQ
jgi:hypothetical protein